MAGFVQSWKTWKSPGFFVLENLEKSWNFPKFSGILKEVMENFRVHVDMYMYMYSDLPHVHGADRRGVRGCAATVLRPRAIIFRISHVMYMGVGVGVGTLVMPEPCMLPWQPCNFSAYF